MENRSRIFRAIPRALAGVTAVVFVALLALGVRSLAITPVFAAPSTPTTQAGSGNQSDKIAGMLVDNFAAQLGVTSDKLNQALLAAVDQTAAQAVQQGLATQAQADQAKAQVHALMQKGGIQAVLWGGIGQSGSSGAASAADIAANPKKAILDTFQSFGITSEQMQSAVNSGESLAQLAAAHGIDAQTLRTDVLRTYRKQLDDAVKANQITASEANSEYSAFETKGLDAILNSTATHVEKKSYTP